MTACCIVVIGHVDHGKTALVRALTGMETDRLPEEKARGLSITPGYAHHRFAGGTLDFIDAPGHEDFVPAMVSGASGAGAALIVISAVEGVREQTAEHLHIAALLGIKDGVVAVTKSDVLPAAEQAVRLKQIRDALAGTVFAEAPMHLCSAVTGKGCDILLSALEDLSMRDRNTSGPRHSLLPIDRVFTLPGRGTIVTGTLLGQDLTLDSAVTLLPSNKPVTLRGLQSRGEDHERIKAGERMAANLRGVAVEDIPRGAVLCSDVSAIPSDCIDVSIDMIKTSVKPLKHMQDLRVLFGTSNEIVQLRLFGGGRIDPGETGLAQLRFKKPVLGFAGQRAVLRRLSPVETIGGAVFLDPNSTPTRMGDQRRLDILRAIQTRDIAQIARSICAAEGGVAPLANIARLSRATDDDAWKILTKTYQLIDAGMIAPRDTIEACKTDILSALARYHVEEPLKTMVTFAEITSSKLSPILTAHALDQLSASGEIRKDVHRVAFQTHDPITSLTADQQQRMVEIEAAFQQAKLTPPATADLLESDSDSDLFNLLVEAGQLISLRNVALNQTLTFHHIALQSAEVMLRASFPKAQNFTTSQARTALNTTRRVIVPILEHFDSHGITARDADIRQMAPANEVSQSDANS